MKKIFRIGAVVALILASSAATATDYPIRLNSNSSFGVTGAFTDVLHFSAPVASTYTITVSSVYANAGCPRFKSCGHYSSNVTAVQLQSGTGTTIVDLPNITPVGNSTFKGAYVLQPGSYQIRVSGFGTGTLVHLNVGTYAVFVAAPVPAPPVYSCEYLRDVYQSQGYTESQTEEMITTLKAKSPPECLGD